MTRKDLAAAMRLKSLAGWNQTESDWRLLLDADPDGSFVACADDEVVGTTTTINYQNRVAWIGMVLVDPDHRRRRIGTRLMRAALEYLKSCETVKLDGTPMGKSLYGTLGFEVEYGLHRWTCGAVPSLPRRDEGVLPITDETLAAVRELDRQAFGVDRSAVLEPLLERAPEAAWRLLEGGNVKAFCLGRQGTSFFQIGPVIAVSEFHARRVAGAALSRLAGMAAVADVPDDQPEFARFLGGLGFTPQRPFTRMYVGPNSHPGDPGKQFAVAGPELG